MHVEVTFNYHFFRTVPTLFSADTFRGSRKAGFKRHARTGGDIEAINYAGLSE